MANLRRVLRAHDIELDHSVPAGDDWESPEHLGPVSKADLIIVNGEGTLHSSRPGAKRIVAIASFADDRRIPSVLLNTVWEGNSDEMIRHVRRFTRVIVRESASRSALERAGVQAVVTPDMTFAYSLKAQRRDSPAGSVVITGSANPRTANQLYAAWRRNSSARFISIDAVSPKCADEPEISGDHRLALDRRKFKRFTFRTMLRSLRRGVQIEKPVFNSKEYGFETLEDLLEVLSSARLVVTGYFHVACLCIQLEVPFVAMRSNTHKIEGLLTDCGLSHRFLRAAPCDLSESAFAVWQDGELRRVRAYKTLAQLAIGSAVSSFAALDSPLRSPGG